MSVFKHCPLPLGRALLAHALLLSLACFGGLSLGVGTAEAQQREYFQWEDDDGTVNFGDNPPADAKNVRKFTPEGRPRRGARNDRQRFNEEQDKLTKDLNQRQGAEETEDQIDTAKELLAKQKEMDRARCNSMRNNLNTYNSGGRVFDTDPTTGLRRYLSDDEISTRRSKTETSIRKDCP